MFDKKEVYHTKLLGLGLTNLNIPSIIAQQVHNKYNNNNNNIYNNFH